MQEPVYPVQDDGGWTKVPNFFIDSILPDLSGAEAKVLLFIIRKTYGWNKERVGDAISLSQISQGAGVARVTAAAAVAGLKAKGIIVASPRRALNGGQGSTFFTFPFFRPSPLATMPYADYLRTEHWQGVRTAALTRAHNRCQLCDAAGVLNVHHRTYARRGREKPQDVIVLCRPCHERHHEVLPAPEGQVNE